MIKPQPKTGINLWQAAGLEVRVLGNLGAGSTGVDTPFIWGAHTAEGKASSFLPPSFHQENSHTEQTRVG